MVTDRDIACRAVADGIDCNKLTTRDVMTKGVVYCLDSEDVDDAIRIMEQKQVRRLPVINEKKRLVGMLSLGDISHATSHELTARLWRLCLRITRELYSVCRLPLGTLSLVGPGSTRTASRFIKPSPASTTTAILGLSSNGWQSGDGRVEAFGQGGRLPNTKNAAATPSY